jgi:hypothetical protein
VRRLAARGIALFCAALALGGCGDSASYRYKLTLSLDTPDGVKTGFNVVEIDYRAISIPGKGELHGVRGQALYLDLGPGRRRLIALLSRIRRSDDRPGETRWDQDEPTLLMAQLCLNDPRFDTWIEVVAKFEACQRPFKLTPHDLPDLVTFADVNDPKSVILVDPNNLAATLGPGVSWRSMTLQTTDAPLTKGIDEHLPWVKTYQKNIPISGMRIFESWHAPYISARSFILERQ